jgi:hypothetical protein
LADIDADGDDDLISGSWPGEIFLFRRGPGGEFEAPEKIKGRGGKAINIGGGIRDQGAGGMLLVAGDAQFESTDEGQFIVYEGERIKVEPGRQAGITGTASSVCVADWDGDGDFDLIVGEISGSVWLVPNEGTPEAFGFGEEQHLPAGAEQIRVAGDAGPFAADWDGDGDLDLLVGDGQGAVTLYRNEGSREAPVLASGETLVPGTSMDYANPPEGPTPGMRTKVCAADWDGDGDLDLLVGDYTIQAPDLPEPSPEQEEEHERLRAQLAEVEGRYRTLIDRYFATGEDRIKEEQERKKLQEELSEVSEEMQSIRGKLPQEQETHGWVWFYERRPSAQEAGGD